MGRLAKLMVAALRNIVSIQELASFLPIDDRRIQQLVGNGVIKRLEGKRGQYLLRESIEGYIQFTSDGEKVRKKMTRAETADTKIKEIKAETVEDELRLRRSELVLGDNIEIVLNDVVQQWNQIFDSIPMKIRRRYPEYAKLTNDAGERLDSMIRSEIGRQRNVVPDLQRVRSIDLLLDDDALEEDEVEVDKPISSSSRVGRVE